MLYNLLYYDDCFTIQEKATNLCYTLHQYMVYLTFEEYLNITDKRGFKTIPELTCKPLIL